MMFDDVNGHSHDLKIRTVCSTNPTLSMHSQSAPTEQQKVTL